MKRIKVVLSMIFFMSVSLLLSGKVQYVSAAEEERICSGVLIDTVDVSGMNEAEASEAVENYVNELQGKGIAVLVGENSIYTTLGDIGYTCDPSESIKHALGLGKEGNLIQRFKDLKDIEHGNLVIQLEFSYDDELLKKFVENDVSAYNIAPVNASLKRDQGDFVYIDHQVGTKVNVEQTVGVIKDIIDQWDHMDIVVDAVVEDDMPKYLKEDVEKCDTVIGEFSTEFKESSNDRAGNLENGARLINNAVLYPGDVFSCTEYLAPFTVENGYFIAHAYANGEVIDSIGGGSCQVATTLYNAVLYAELEVVERQAHSMTVSYVDVSRDAAIAEGSKDFKFKNNTDAPLLIEAVAQDRKITFRIWGHETRDTENRRVDFESKVISEIQPPKDLITEDPTQPTTYKQVTQKAYIGYKAELYKIVYENDVEVSRTQINSSTYKATPNHITVGTKKEDKKEDEKAAKKDEDKADQKDDNKVDENQESETADNQ